MEAPIGQDYGANTHGKRPNHSQKGVLLKLVLALVRAQAVPIVGQLQQRRGRRVIDSTCKRLGISLRGRRRLPPTPSMLYVTLVSR
jgi:hypothetical protein